MRTGIGRYLVTAHLREGRSVVDRPVRFPGLRATLGRGRDLLIDPLTPRDRPSRPFGVGSTPPSGADAETVADVQVAMRRGGALIAWDGTMAVGAARWEVAEDALYVAESLSSPAIAAGGSPPHSCDRLRDLAPSLGREAIRVGVRASLPENIALYRSLGYEIVSIEGHQRGPDHVVAIRKRVQSG